MKAFRYTALGADGRRHRSVGYAADAAALRDRLLDARLHPLVIRRALLQQPGRLRLTEAEAARLGRDLAQLMTSGMALAQALALLETRETPRMGAIAREVRQRLIAGEPLSRALEVADGTPARFLQALARGGEASGRQSEVLAAGARSLAAADQLKKRLITLCLYPAFVILVAFGSIAIYAYAVLPSLEPAFEGMGGDLPAQTRAVLTFGVIVRVLMPVLGAVAGGLAVALALLPPARRLAGDLVAWLLMRGKRSPLRDFVFANLASRLAVMLQAGVPLAPAWRLAREPVTIASLSRALAAQDERLMEGVRLSEVLRRVAVCPPDLIHYVQMGETSGQIAAALNDGSADLAARAQEAIERVLSVLTPLVIIVVGGLVGLITMMVFQGLLAVGDAVAM
ncbi:type II secretion system F family protein [Brevundimonas sp.]|uniref:type II secretion system F family protein n=1 Tax=Brevundimonas sp. TaxID=1871086 RepID=UPI002D646396|nr:type II secretion system F family protein [Brevundimonas sp.]HYC98451.1 type II secretion system F family protein [Brevundimonas sp.]